MLFPSNIYYNSSAINFQSISVYKLEHSLTQLTLQWVNHYMPFKSTKQDSAEALVLEWNMQIKNYKLALDKKRCVGCEICTAACPKAAITTTKQPKMQGEAAKKPQVDIDQSKCNFCGVCDVFCPYGAVKVTANGTHDLSILAKESYPQLTRDITINTAKCDKECTTCETACPLNLIKISKVGYDGKPVQDVSKLSPTGKRRKDR